MRKLAAALGAGMILSISLAAGVAQARTPTPTATSSPLPLPSPSPSPTATPTMPPDQVAIFRARAWLDARLTGETIVAKIGETECSQSFWVPIVCDPSSCGPVQDVEVVSNNIKPGCGFDGAEITFFIEGKRAPRTTVWHAGRQIFNDVVAGFPFASIWGVFSWPGQLPILDLNADETRSVLVPYIGNTVCGYGSILRPETGASGRTEDQYLYSLVVYSDEQRAGCGTEGALITFKLADGQGNTLATAEQKGIWHAWDGMRDTSEILDLTLMTPGGIRIGSVGTGCSQGRGGAPVGVVALGLGIAGITTVAAGATLRKRAIRRNS